MQRWATFIAWAAFAVPTLASAEDAMLRAVRLGGDQNATRVVLDIAGKASPRYSPTPGPDAVVALAGVASDGATEGPGKGLVTGWKLTPTQDGLRLAVTLAAKSVVRNHFLMPPDGANPQWRYVLDIGPVEAPPPPAALTPIGMTAPAQPGVKKTLAPRRATPMAPAKRVVVIDAGHGGHDPGAHGDDHEEKEVTLAAALSLKARLEKTGRYRVIMTRTDDTFIPLEDRVKISRAAHADLFLSLHADSAGDDQTPHGASVYTVNDQGQTRVHTVLGADNWFQKASVRARDPRVGQILLDLSQHGARDQSERFAELLVAKIGDKVDLLPRSHRDANYFVLLAPDVPAALLEMGFISNPRDEERLADPAQRAKLMDGVAQAIDAFFAKPRQLAMN